MSPERELIERCVKQDLQAQEELYRRFAPKMYGVCLRFARNRMEAEDILQDGFIKVFKHMSDYRFEGVFEGWVRRTFINTAINFYKKKSKDLIEINSEKIELSGSTEANIIEAINASELLQLIQELPEGYRLVFNLHIIEGYSHKEIGQMLNISENTSKSQLSRARTTLQNIINKRK